MSKFHEIAIKDIFPLSMSGEWGSEPNTTYNAFALRAADFTKDCKLKQKIGVPRLIPKEILAKKHLINGDILIEKSGGSPEQPVGRVAFFNRGYAEILYVHSNFLHILRAADNFDKKFCYYLLAHLYFSGHTFRYQQQTTGIINLKLEDYLKEKVFVPTHEAQQKIARILQTIDQTIEKTEALIEKYQQIKAGLMHDLFTRGIGADGKLRPPREEAPELYQETEIGWIPREWIPYTLPQVASYQHGRPFPSSQYSDDGFLLLRPGNLHISGFVEFDDAHSTRVPHSWAISDPSYIITSGDILMNLTAQSLDDEFLGRVCLYEQMEPSLLNQRIARFKTQSLDHEFLYWILRSKLFRKQIDSTSQGTKVQHLYNRDLNKVILGIPKILTEQIKIRDRLRYITIKIRNEERSLQKIIKQKSGLMHDLLTGKVPVSIDPEPHPEAAHV